ncbi:MAG: FAD binding domain-containing protein [Xanthomonadales bacterium]|nr:FAD binding domain-containing protein [Xanthomonadales bacterium]
MTLSGVEPTQSLLRWLRTRGLSGTKEGCGDGDCGACTVVWLECDQPGASQLVAVNSCLLPMGALPGREVLTVEAVADGDQLHPVQAALSAHNGSQCGYCTPGIVMSLLAGYYGGELSDHTTDGNLCRCTGYRPIREATSTLARQAQANDRFRLMLAQTRTAPAASRIGSFHSPVTLTDAIALKQHFPDAAFIAGATDLGVNLSRHQAVAPAFIALDRIAELQTLVIETDQVRIGAGVPLTRLEHELSGLIPALDDMLPWFAARQVRNRATLGGNLGTASPIGDLLPALLAMDATVHCRSASGARDVPIDQFFLGYRQTALRPDELIEAVTLPRRDHWTIRAYKVAKRQTDDISIVAAVFGIERDADGLVCQARLAFGGVAAVPVRATAAEAALLGQPLDMAQAERVAKMLGAAFTPLSDLRASADYRRALCGNLFVKFVRAQAAGQEAIA